MDLPFNGLGMHLGNLARLSNAQTRSISAENPTGARGQGGRAAEGTGAVAARELGRGWKVSPSINVAGNGVVTLADVQGIEYLRSQTPEYLRQIEHGSLRSFLDETQYVSLAFGATLTVAGYWIGQAIGRFLSIWPIGKFIKRF